MWKAKRVKIRLFRLFRPKSGLFRQKEDQFRSIFSKRSAIRPRSDKADLLGSTELGGGKNGGTPFIHFQRKSFIPDSDKGSPTKVSTGTIAFLGNVSLVTHLI